MSFTDCGTRQKGYAFHDLAKLVCNAPLPLHTSCVNWLIFSRKTFIWIQMWGYSSGKVLNYFKIHLNTNISPTNSTHKHTLHSFFSKGLLPVLRDQRYTSVASWPGDKWGLEPLFIFPSLMWQSTLIFSSVSLPLQLLLYPYISDSKNFIAHHICINSLYW